MFILYVLLPSFGKIQIVTYCENFSSTCPVDFLTNIIFLFRRKKMLWIRVAVSSAYSFLLWRFVKICI